jgi:UDP-2,3-diacylglucosamine pyrophosphatase LpxH
MNGEPTMISEETIAGAEQNIVNAKVKVLMESCRHIPWNKDSKGIVFSDLHMGVGDVCDKFAQNAELFFRVALDFYKQGYFLFFGGDVYDLWLNDSLEQIRQQYGQIEDLFWAASLNKRFFRIGGNHDRELELEEAVIIDADPPILMLHGYQGDYLNDEGWKIGRWVTRHVYRPILEEGIELDSPLTAAYGERHDLVREAYITWANENKHRLIMGHTHKSENQGFYWNSGSWREGPGGQAVEIIGNDLNLRQFV